VHQLSGNIRITHNASSRASKLSMPQQPSEVNADKTQLLWLGNRQQLHEQAVSERGNFSVSITFWATISALPLTAS